MGVKKRLELRPHIDRVHYESLHGVSAKIKEAAEQRVTLLHPHRYNISPTLNGIWVALRWQMKRRQAAEEATTPATSHILSVTLPFLILRKLNATVGTTSSLHYVCCNKNPADLRKDSLGPMLSHSQMRSFPRPDNWIRSAWMHFLDKHQPGGPRQLFQQTLRRITWYRWVIRRRISWKRLTQQSTGELMWRTQA